VIDENLTEVLAGLELGDAMAVIATPPAQVDAATFADTGTDDTDLYFVETWRRTESDCKDLDGSIHPGVCDVEDDGIDQDCDGRDRARGRPCLGRSDGGGDSGGSKGKDKTCKDGQNNNGDELIACADAYCARNKTCR